MSRRKRRDGDDKNSKPPSKKIEEHAIVIDVLPHGRSPKNFDEDEMPLIICLGELWFTIIELSPSLNADLLIGDRIYIGKTSHHGIIHRKIIRYNALTTTAESELDAAIDQAINNTEKRFVDWINRAPALGPMKHALELLPGIGKQTMKSILKERSQMPFTSLQDVEDRAKVSGIHKIIRNRILDEIKEDQKYYIFTIGRN